MAVNLYDTDFLLQTPMENIADNIYFKDAESRFIMVNRAFSNGADITFHNPM